MFSVRWAISVLTFCAVLGTGQAQTLISTSWQLPNSGNWEDPFRWSGNVVPNNSVDFAYEVSITAPVTVTMNSNHGVNRLLLNQSALILGSNKSLDLAQSLSAGEGATVQLQGGSIGFPGNTQQLGTISLGATVVSGYGSLGSTEGIVRNFANGTIQADFQNQTLTVVNATDSSGMQIGVNAGLMRAVNGGRLTVFGGPVDNTGGTIRAELGSTVDIYAPIRGGTLAATVAFPETTTPSGILNLRGLIDGSASPITILGNATIISGCSFKGTVSINGTLSLTPSLLLKGPTTIAGNGTLTLANGGISSDAGGPYLFNNAGPTISGYGIIDNLTLSNSGTIEASVFNQTLTVSSSGPTTNSGILRALNGGRLIFQGTTLDNSNGTISVGDGLSTVLLDIAVRGGTLDGLGTGTLNWRNLLDGSAQTVTILGRVGSNNNSTLKGTLNNQGVVTLAQGTKLSGDTIFDGAGRVTLAGAGLDGGASLTVQLTNINNTIDGTGAIGTTGPVTLINSINGMIESNSSITIQTAGTSMSAGTIRTFLGSGNLALNVPTGGFSNSGVIRAESSSIITINGNFANSGLLRAEGAGKLRVNGLTNLDAQGTLTGGRYEIVGNGSWLSLPGSVVTNAAAITIDGTTAELRNSFTNTNGLALTNITQSGSLTLLNGPAATSLFGGLVLSSLTNDGSLRLGQSSKLIVFGNYTQTGFSEVTDAGSNLTVFGTFSLEGGELRGRGTVTTATVVAGTLVTTTISPGLSPGRLNLASNLVLGNHAKLAIEVGGTGQGTTYDLLNVAGSSAFGSPGSVAINSAKLEVRLIAGFEATILPTDTFTFLTAGGPLTGTFDGLPDGSRFTTADGLGSFQINYFGNDVVLSNYAPVPEPVYVLTICLMVLAFRTKTRDVKYRQSVQPISRKSQDSELYNDVINTSSRFCGI